MKTKFGILVSFFSSLCVVCAYLILLLVLGSLTGCTAMAQTEPGSETGFHPVLQGHTSFFSTDARQSLSINELGQAAGIDSSITVKPIKFAVIDLDSNWFYE